MASTTAFFKDPHVGSIHDPRTESFVHSCMGRLAMTREEVIERALKYGALELAVKSNENTEVRVKATIERAHSHGLESFRLQMGVSRGLL